MRYTTSEQRYLHGTQHTEVRLSDDKAEEQVDQRRNALPG